MKAISIMQPFAQLIAERKKTLEIRSFKTKLRGDILICSSISLKFIEQFELKDKYEFEFGKAICIAELYDVKPFTVEMQDLAFCDFSPGQFAWMLRDIRVITPFPVRGMPGIFNVDYA